MTLSKLSREYGLTIYSFMPTANAASMCSCLAFPLSPTIGILFPEFNSFRRMRRVASRLVQVEFKLKIWEKRKIGGEISKIRKITFKIEVEKWVHVGIQIENSSWNSSWRFKLKWYPFISGISMSIRIRSYGTVLFSIAFKAFSSYFQVEFQVETWTPLLAISQLIENLVKCRWTTFWLTTLSSTTKTSKSVANDGRRGRTGCSTTSRRHFQVENFKLKISSWNNNEKISWQFETRKRDRFKIISEWRTCFSTRRFFNLIATDVFSTWFQLEIYLCANIVTFDGKFESSSLFWTCNFENSAHQFNQRFANAQS